LSSAPPFVPASRPTPLESRPGTSDQLRDDADDQQFRSRSPIPRGQPEWLSGSTQSRPLRWRRLRIQRTAIPSPPTVFAPAHQAAAGARDISVGSQPRRPHRASSPSQMTASKLRSRFVDNMEVGNFIFLQRLRRAYLADAGPGRARARRSRICLARRSAGPTAQRFSCGRMREARRID
jgi:hypothetical protein